ncbi:hypothetical protein [uncultured Mailhella sp.]|uniref:hypothetical protein n=1 Tax=uncultured Mailhella sp. TaxID=1981031 RepID=UPI0026304C2F|nr:hypothetical protein [uncultured Mailhella sp.]
MTLKRAIRIASAWSQGHVCTLRDGEAEEYHKMALEAFRAMREAEKNEPLTLDELRQMDGEPAWFVSFLDNFCCWGIVRVVTMSQTWFIAVAGAERAFGDRDSYGKSWLAYRSPPEKEEQNG